MRFLDLDLDAFLNEVAHFVEPDAGRLDDAEFTPWDEDRLRAFLEKQCGLSRNKPIDGWFVSQHDEAFDIMLTLVERGGRPLEVVHVDGHADLGMGDQSWVDLIRRVALPLENRRNPPRWNEGLNPGSWLAYAVTAELVGKIAYVYPVEGGDDLPPLYFRDCDTGSDQLVMKAFTRPGLPMMGTTLDYEMLCNLQPDVSLRPVPFSRASLNDYMTDLSFDVGLLCHSPNFTPQTSDRLIPVIGEYINLKDWPKA